MKRFFNEESSSMKKVLLALLITLLPASALAWKLGISGSAPPSGTVFADVPLGAGGLVNGIAIEASGTKLIRSDVGGCWIWKVGATRWAPLVTTTSMPPGVPNVDNGLDCFEIAYAKSNPNHIYIHYGTTVYSSTNLGQTFTATALPANTVTSNGKVFSSATMAVDPINENVVYVGVPTVGVYFTTNGGTSWTLIASSSIASGGSVGGTPMANMPLFDPSSATTGGRTNGIFVQSYGVGVYHSTDAGVTWTLMPSSPVQVQFWAITSAGKLYTTSTGPNSASAFSGGVWTGFTTGLDTISEGPGMPAIDPTNETHVAMVGLGGSVSLSVDSGGHWSTPGPNTAVNYTGIGDIPWLGWAQGAGGTNRFCDCTQAAFDQTGTNTLYATMGIGVMHQNPTATNGVDPPWQFQSLGIEELVANVGVTPPGGSFLAATWDRPFFNSGPLLLTLYPAIYGPPGTPSVPIVAGWDLDYQAPNPAIVVGPANFNNHNYSGYSTDGGVNWNVFPVQTTPESLGAMSGGMAIDNAGDIATYGCGPSAYVAVSHDTGHSWINATSMPNSGWCFAFYLARHVIASDKVDPHTFYVFNQTNGFYRSTDGGVTWTLMHAPILCCGYDGFNATLKATPTRSGEIWFTGGSVTPGPHPVGEPFSRSQDGGATWATFGTDVQEVRFFGFGAPAPGRTNSALWLYGWVNCASSAIAVTCLPGLSGVQGGVFVSIDDMVSLRQVTNQFPANSMDAVKWITGDMNSWGRFYVGWTGTAFKSGVLPDAILKPIVSLQNVNTSVPAQATITWQTDLVGASNSVDYGLSTAYGSSASAPSGQSPSVTLTGLANFSLYHYRVRSGSSASMDLTFRTVNTVPPNAPTGLTATVVDDSSVNLNWSAATGDPQGVAGYKVYVGGVLRATLGNVLSTTVTGLEPNTSYSFTVSAFDATPNEGPQSAPALATTLPAGVTWVTTDQPNFTVAAGLTTTFAGLNVGASGTNKQTLACVQQGDMGGVTSVTMNGTPMTLVADSTAADLVFGPNTSGSQLYEAPHPAGATATFAVTLASLGPTNAAVGIQVGSLTTTHPSPVASGAALWATGLVLSPPVTIPSFGIAIMCVVSFGTIPTMPGTSAVWLNGTQDNYSVNSFPAFLFGGLAHLYSSGSQQPAVSGVNGFGQAVGVWQP